MKAAVVLPVGMFYCCTGCDGTIRGCPVQSMEYDEGSLRDRSFEETGVVCDGGKCVVCDEKSKCGRGC